MTAHQEVVATNALPAPQSEAAGIMQAIVKLTSNPQFNPEGMERMMAMYERIKDREAQAAFNMAMTAAQQEMRPVATDADNPQTRSRYASYYTLDKALRPIYTKHGLALSFNTAPAKNDTDICVICYVTCGGYVREYSIVMPADGKGAKGGDVMTRTHATGSAATYGMRYLLKMIFNVAVGSDGTDDDGNAAGRKPPKPPRSYISQDQAYRLREILGSQETETAFLTRIGVGQLEGIWADKYDAALKIASTMPRNAPKPPMGASGGHTATPGHPEVTTLPGAIPVAGEGELVEKGGAGFETFDPKTGEVREWHPHLDYAGEPMKPGEFRDPPEGPPVKVPPRPPQPPRPSNALPVAAANTSNTTTLAKNTATSAANPSHPLGPLSAGLPNDPGPIPAILVRGETLEALVKHRPDFKRDPITSVYDYIQGLFKLVQTFDEFENVCERYIDPFVADIPKDIDRDGVRGYILEYEQRWAP